MILVVIKTGAERYANRVYTSDFYLMKNSKDSQPVSLTSHHSYMAHEEVVCGLNGCLGRWEVGHVVLRPESIILGIFTKKILMYDPHHDTSGHVYLENKFIVPGKKDRRFTLNYWGYNGGKEICELLLGKFNYVKQKKETYKINTPLDKLPF